METPSVTIGDLPGWPVEKDRITIPIPDGITLREDTELVYVCTPGRVYPLSANLGTEILTIIIKAIARDMALAAELAPNGMAFSTQEGTER